MNHINDETIRKLIEEELRLCLQKRQSRGETLQSRSETDTAFLVLCTGPWKDATSIVPQLRELASSFPLTFILSASFQEDRGEEQLRQRIQKPVRILSRVTHEALKQEIAAHPMLVVAPFSSNTLAKVALGVHDSVPSRLIFEALCQHTPVVAVPPSAEPSSNGTLESHYPYVPSESQNGRPHYLRTVANWGIRFVDSDKLVAEVRTLLHDGVQADRKRPSSDRRPRKRPVITKEDVQQIILQGKRELHISPDTILTDVAKELAASAGIQIVIR